MANAITPRFNSAPPAYSFSNLPANFTTANFVLPAFALVELRLKAADPNNPGTCTLQDAANSNAALVSVNTSEGDVQGFTGSVYYTVPDTNKTVNINVTQAAQGITLYMTEIIDVQ